MGFLRGSNGHEVGLRRGIYWPFDDELNYQTLLKAHSKGVGISVFIRCLK